MLDQDQVSQGAEHRGYVRGSSRASVLHPRDGYICRPHPAVPPSFLPPWMLSQHHQLFITG